MVKSKSSMTGAGRSGGLAPEPVVKGSAGDYPESMEQLLLDSNGHVSLDASDYAPYTRDEVEAFLASRPYEVHVVFAPDGTVLTLNSQWRDGSVRSSIYTDEAAIKKFDPNSDGSGFSDMHFHPDDKRPGVRVYQIFSPTDIGAYTDSTDRRTLGWPRTYTLPDTYSVKAYDGSRFELTYVGGGSRDYHNFKSAYSRAFNKARKEAKSWKSQHGGYDNFLADETTAKVDEWLKGNASKYGFRYNSNWTMRPVS